MDNQKLKQAAQSTSENFHVPNHNKNGGKDKDKSTIAEQYDRKKPRIQKSAQNNSELMFEFEDNELTEIQSKLSKLSAKIQNIKQSNIYDETISNDWEDQNNLVIKLCKKQQKQTTTNLKNQIIQKVNILDKQLHELLKTRKAQKCKQQKQMHESVQELKGLKQVWLKMLEKKRNQKFQRLRQSNKKLQKEVRQTIKETKQSRNKTMYSIEIMRARLLDKIDAEQKKRYQKNAILENLMETTCDKVAENIRRSITQ